MRFLVAVSMYPHPGHPYSGIFNRNCVEAAERLGHEIVVLAPRPYVPPFLKVHPRWSAYAQIPKYSKSGTVEVHRPDLIQVPRIATTFQRNQGAYLQTRGVARKLHRERNFDAVFSFDLSGAGGLAWRLGNDLNIPATGWAFGLDVRVPHDSADAAELDLMLSRLDMVFYQSSELRDCAESYYQGGSLDIDKHLVLPHGIPELSPPSDDLRSRMRNELSITNDQVVVLFLSRVVEGKGINELLTAFEQASKDHKNLFCLIVGETPGFDDSEALKTQIREKKLDDRIRLLPACKPEEVANYQAAADIFAFPSKSEGMPNALLEAMATGTPSVVFDIPPICDILAHGPCLAAAKSFEAEAFGKELAQLAGSESRRSELADTAKRVVAEHYNIDENIARALDHVQSLVSPSTPTQV